MDEHRLHGLIDRVKQGRLSRRGFVRRMRRGDAHDPLLLQVLPGARELIETAGFGADPLGEHAATRAPGLLQKYHGRALLISTGDGSILQVEYGVFA